MANKVLGKIQPYEYKSLIQFMKSLELGDEFKIYGNNKSKPKHVRVVYTYDEINEFNVNRDIEYLLGILPVNKTFEDGTAGELSLNIQDNVVSYTLSYMDNAKEVNKIERLI